MKQNFHNDELRDQLSTLREKFFSSGRETMKPEANRDQGHVEQKLNIHNQNPKKAESKKQTELEKTEVIHTICDEALLGANREFKLPGGVSAWKKLEGLYAESKMIEVYGVRA